MHAVFCVTASVIGWAMNFAPHNEMNSVKNPTMIPIPKKTKLEMQE
jgi:hypothetical protein